MSGTDNLIRNSMYPSSSAGTKNLKPGTSNLKPGGRISSLTPERARSLALDQAKKRTTSSRQIAETLRSFAVKAMSERGDDLVKAGEVVSDDGGCIAYMKWLATHPKWTPCFVNLLVRLTPPVKEVSISGEVTIENVVTASYKRLGIPAPVSG